MHSCDLEHAEGRAGHEMECSDPVVCWHTSCQYNTIVDQGGRRLAASRQPVALKCPAHPLASGKGESCECSHGDEPWGSQVPLRPACWRAHLQPPRACRYHTAGPRRPSRRLDHDDERLRLAHPPRVAGAGPPLYPSPCTRRRRPAQIVRGRVVIMVYPMKSQ